MARPPRVERPGGRYHVTAHGNDRNAIFRQDADRFHFLELMAGLGELAGGMDYSAVGRLRKRMERDAKVRRECDRIEMHLSKVET